MGHRRWDPDAAARSAAALGLAVGEVKALAEVCARHGVTLCYLFGSRASGHARPDSDWDLGVLLREPPAAGQATRRWLDLAADLEMALPDREVDLVLLHEAPPRIQYAAIRGILLYATSDLDRANYVERVMREWMDLLPFIEAMERDEQEAILGGHVVA